MAEHVSEAPATGANYRTRESGAPQQLRTAEAAAAVQRLQSHIRQPLIAEELHVRTYLVQFNTCASDVVALLHGTLDDQIDIGQRRTAHRLVHRIQLHSPERCICGIHDEAPQTILGILGSRRCANQVFTPLCDLGLGLQQIERWRLTDIHTSLVLANERVGQVQRALLNLHVRHVGFERPVSLLHRRDRLHGGLTKTQLRALLVSRGNDGLLARRVNLTVFQQRLRERHLKARLKAGLEAAERAVRARPGGIPRDVPRSRALGEPLTHSGRREPIPRVDSALAEKKVRGWCGGASTGREL